MPWIFLFSVWAKHVLCHSRIAFKIIKIYIYARGSGCIRLLPHRQWITDPWKQGKGGFRNGSRKLRRRRNFSCAGLQTTAGRIIKFSLLQHATSPNTWAHILKLLNTCSHVTFLLLELKLYKKKIWQRVCDAIYYSSIRLYWLLSTLFVSILI